MTPQTLLLRGQTYELLRERIRVGAVKI